MSDPDAALPAASPDRTGDEPEFPEPYRTLLGTTEQLNDLARLTQQTENVAERLALRQQLEREYGAWFEQAKLALPDDLRTKFVDAYEGGMWITRIKHYIANPHAPNSLWQEDKPFPGMSRWQYPYEKNFGENFLTQRQLLREGAIRAQRVADSATVNLVVGMGQRFGNYCRQLSTRQRKREGLEVSDEYDMQDVLHAALRLHFDDVRPETWTPTYAGGSSRVDFLLPHDGILVEAKCIGPGDRSRKVADEIIIDMKRYSVQPNCRTLVVFVLDKHHVLANPAALQDLRGDQTMDVRIVVSH